MRVNVVNQVSIQSLRRAASVLWLAGSVLAGACGGPARLAPPVPTPDSRVALGNPVARPGLARRGRRLTARWTWRIRLGRR